MRAAGQAAAARPAWMARRQPAGNTAACGRAGGKVSIIAHMRYCSVAFVQDRKAAQGKHGAAGPGG